MKKSIILAAVAALVLASCAKTETYVKATFDDAVTFGAYSGRTITKAGPTDDMNLDALKQHGFGVFATYSGTADFTEATDDFMYNQQVAYNGTEWAYTPVKYWPNPTNGQAADAQKVSFFAYAPYATSTDWTAETVGITGFSIDPTTKHNLVHYGFSNAKDTPNVDLMWGYKAKDTSTDPATYTSNNNLTRTTDKVSFIFQHLLSKLGGSQEGEITDPTAAGYVANGLLIKANAETVTPTNLFGTANGTKITVSKNSYSDAHMPLLLQKLQRVLLLPAEDSLQPDTTAILSLNVIRSACQQRSKRKPFQNFLPQNFRRSASVVFSSMITSSVPVNRAKLAMSSLVREVDTTE